MCVAISEAQVSVDGSQPKFTASFGVVAAGKGSLSIDALLIRGDDALYDAKESGRNRICMAKSEKR